MATGATVTIGYTTATDVGDAEMQTYRNTLNRAATGAYRFAQDSGPVTLPIIIVMAALEVLL